MTSILPTAVVPSTRAAVCAAVAIAWLAVAPIASACETAPDLSIEVTSRFDTTPVRNDYTLADIAALARQQHRDLGRALLGFYTSAFGYTVDLLPEGDAVCPTRIATTVTLRLQNRLIEIGRDVAANSCVYPGALRHYRRLAAVDEQTVQRFGARAAAMLAQASPTLKQTHASHAEDLDAALRDQIRALVDRAVAPLHDARQDAQQAVNSAGELKQLASDCSI
ncbi:MAG: hypothetical protein QOH05_4880 [Acetobacteraceae bacterium]|jgi:hypothetical protein|nr:hypothetical protein [Acetobacteraceae bacterium]